MNINERISTLHDILSAWKQWKDFSRNDPFADFGDEIDNPLRVKTCFFCGCGEKETHTEKCFYLRMTRIEKRP